MRGLGLALAATAASASLACGPLVRADDSVDRGSVFGVWRNPKNSVHVKIEPCGRSACGEVVWANAKAKADAREGGTEQLIGLQLFREMREKDGVWRGKVFVPDVNRTFTGSAEPLGSSKLKAKGCVLGGLICKAQTWTRIDQPPGLAAAQ